MNKRWLALMRTGNLTCHICGLVILSARELTHDHYPIPRSKGGIERLPSHRWCDNAHKDHLDAKNPKYLERLITSWNHNGTMFSRRAYKSVYKLHRDLIASRRPSDDEIKRSVDFLFGVPNDHRNAEWGENLKLFVDLMRSGAWGYRKKISLDIIVRG
jgi:hypothetical protein